MGDDIEILIKDSCPYISREKRDECWEGEQCSEVKFDNYSGEMYCKKIKGGICEIGGPLDFDDEVSIMEEAYGPLTYEEKQEILDDRTDILLGQLESVIEKAFSSK